MSTQPRRISYIGEGAVAVVVIKRRSIIGKVSAEKVEIAVAVVIGNGGAHSSLFAAICVVSHTRENALVRERSVAIVMVEDTRRAVASHVDVRPTVVIIIEG